MLFFSDRLKLEKMFYKWARSQTPMVKECPNSLIAFLEGNSLLNEEKVRHFIEKSSKQIPTSTATSHAHLERNEHGRLGDLDRLAKEVKDMAKEFPPDSIGAERYRLFAEFVKTAPTIIPAEEGET